MRKKFEEDHAVREHVATLVDFFNTLLDELWSHPAKGACLSCFFSCNLQNFGRPEVTNFDDIFFLKEKDIGGF